LALRVVALHPVLQPCAWFIPVEGFMNMLRRLVPVAAVVGLGALLVPLAATPALAHEERDFGAFHVEVGFGDEPPYIGEKNSVQLLLSSKDGKPITDLGDSLQVEVSTGGNPPMKGSLEPNFEVGGDGIPGDYRFWFIPTQPGKYTFHFTGTIHGQRVDQSFTSSPTGFDEVKDVAAVEYPVKDPTTGQLNARLNNEVPRLDSAGRRANDTAHSAKTLAVVGIVVGAVGLLVGAVGLGFGLRRRGGGAAGVPADAGPRSDVESTV
jgi:hypothetical protein